MNAYLFIFLLQLSIIFGIVDVATSINIIIVALVLVGGIIVVINIDNSVIISFI